MPKKKILIMSMTGGFGHIRAGDALLDYAKENLPNIVVEHIDVMNVDASLKKYAQLYDTISKKFPFIWEIIYKYTLVFFIIKKAIAVKGLLNNKIKNYIYKKNPDIILFTNVITLPMFADGYKKEFPNVKMGVVVTDYHGHYYYHFPYIDYYFVANLQVRDDLESMGIKREKITITGIPINPRFYIKESIGDLKLKYGIEDNLPIILFIASFRISKNDLVSVMRQLLEFESKMNVIFVANGNQEFYDIIEKSFPNHARILLVNWTNVMEEYMKISDIVISKAGGLTVSECLSLQKPLMMVRPIPGQEEHNAEFMEKNNFGLRVADVSEIVKLLPKMMLLSKNNALPLFPLENPLKKIFQTIL